MSLHILVRNIDHPDTPRPQLSSPYAFFQIVSRWVGDSAIELILAIIFEV